MNLLLLHPDEALDEHRFRLEGPRATRLRGAQVGQAIHVGVMDGPLGRAVVTALQPALELEVELEPAPPARPRTRVLLAVHRPKSLRRLVPQLAAMGLDELVLFRSWRVDRAYLESERITPEALEPLCLEGMEQGGLTHRPRIRRHDRFMDLVEAEGAGSREGEFRMVAHPRAPGLEPTGAWSGAAVVIGPEGGLLDEEVEALGGVGFVPRSMAFGMVRVETAVVAALAQLRLLESWAARGV